MVGMKFKCLLAQKWGVSLVEECVVVCWSVVITLAYEAAMLSPMLLMLTLQVVLVCLNVMNFFVCD